MLIACKSCRRQLDVEGIGVGEHVRCRCGELLVVPNTRPHEARVLHCSGCGGKLRAGAGKCDYCAGEITLAERNLGHACPECYARMPRGSRFCCECGIEIKPVALRASRASARCPRCQGELVICDHDQGRFTECSACGGIWLDATTFDTVLTQRDTEALTASIRTATTVKSAAPVENTVKYLPCPSCGTLMNRRNFAGGSGIIVDSCKGHGYWFDAAELEKVLEFIKAGGLDRVRQRELDRARQELARAQDARRSLASSPLPWSPRENPVTVDLGDVWGGLVKLGGVLRNLVK